MKHCKSLSALAMIVSLAACAQTGAPQDQVFGTSAQPFNPANVVDPISERIKPAYLDQTYSLSDVVDERLNGGLNSNDRRFIDQALNEVMAKAPDAEAKSWGNPANGHTGSVDLTNIFIDGRAGAACALIIHDEKLGDTTLKGDVTFCRSSENGPWLRDSVNWASVAEAAPTKPKSPSQPKPTQPATSSQTTTNGGTVLEPANTPNPVRNQRKITVPTNDGVPDGEGAQSLGGSILEDQSPHIEAD